MELRLGLTRKRVATFVVLAGLVTAGVAYATIPDSNGVYTACKLNATGTIRLIDPSLPPANLMSHCVSVETQVSWNQVGQQGPQGTQGPQGNPGKDGTNGAPGPTGPSDAYVDESNVFHHLVNGPTDVAHVVLPAGSYIVFAKATLFNTVAPEPNLPVTAGCDLLVGVDQVDSGQLLLQNVDGSDAKTVSLAHSFTLSTQSSATFRCGASDSQAQTPVGTVAANVRLTAIKVGTIH